MTKSEFVDQVADRVGPVKGEAGKAVDAVLDRSRDAEARWRDQLHRLRQVLGGRSRRPPGRKPADRRADPDRGQPGAAVQRRLRVEEGRQGRLAAGPPGSARRRPGVATHFCDRLAALVEERRSRVVLGLDPDPAALWPGARAPPPTGGERNRAAPGPPRRWRATAAPAIDAAGPACVAVKPQLACFERLGAPGLGGAARRPSHAREHGLLVIADGKRGDVPVTARAYAQALVGETPGPFGPVPGLGADAFTANPLLGRDSLEPLVEAAATAGAGCFVLVRTSNPGAAEIQDAGDPPLHERLAALVDGIGAGHVGRVRPLAGGGGHGGHAARAARPPARADAARDLPAARRRRAGRARRGPGRRRSRRTRPPVS